MHKSEINGKHVTDCLDCHSSRGMSNRRSANAERECNSLSSIIPVEKCFQCHFDPRQLALNPMGVVMTHYGGTHHAETGGLLCQDCHISSEMHGTVAETGVAQLEIKCEDCHGTVTAAPATQDGFLLTSRGNPFGNVVKDDDRVILRSASGRDFAVPILELIGKNDDWKNRTARQAMFEVAVHRERMSCTTCHADWARPCFGCHVEVGGTG
jgi:hypothetical protein